MSVKKKSSGLWRLFKQLDDIYAKCNICNAQISYKTTTSNLKKHLISRHPTVGLPEGLTLPDKDLDRGSKRRAERINEMPIKTDYSEDSEKNDSLHEENMMYDNLYYGEYKDFEPPHVLNEAANDNTNAFESIVVSKTLDEQQQCEIPPYKRIRMRRSSVVSTSGKDILQDKKISKNAAQVQSLCEMIKVDLQDVSDELFFDAKWRIMDVLREVHRKHLENKSSAEKFIDHSSEQSTAVTSIAAVMPNNQ